MIVLFEKNANGKIEFTKEELEALLEQARQEGIKERKANALCYGNALQSPLTVGTPQAIPGDALTMTGTQFTKDVAEKITDIQG